MKKSFNRRSTLLATGAFVLMTLLFAACKKSLDVNNNTPLSAVMAFNLATDKTAVGIALSGTNITNAPLAFSNYTGTYITIYPGSRKVASIDYNTGAALDTTTQDFELNKYYSVFVTGANGVYKNVVVKDNFDSLTAASGQAYIRYINAIPDSSKPNVTITAGSTAISNKNESFTAVSEFAAVSPGDINVKISNGSTISVNRTITVEKGKVYTILLVGVPGSTDTEKTVQIKYITNGTAD